MGRLRRKVWILLGCGIAVVLILMLWREREPQYQGRSLSNWVLALDVRDPPYVNGSSVAQEAIQQIGTNALPFLLKWIQYREPPWRRRVVAFCAGLPRKFAGPLSNFFAGHGQDRQQGAFSALYVLGPDAEASIPTLTHLIDTQPPGGPVAVLCMRVLAHLGSKGLAPILAVLTNQSSPYRLLAASALAGPDAKDTFNEAVATALTRCLEDEDTRLALCAAQILCVNNSHQEAVMRTFIESLEDHNKQIRWVAIVRLQDCLMRGFSIPTLVQFLQDTNSPLSAYSAGALGDFAYHYARLPDTVLPALTNSLRDPRPLVRSYAATAVGHFRELAEPAVPALLDLCNDPDESVRLAATNAFFGLPSYAVLMTVSEWPTGTSERQIEVLERMYGAPRLRKAARVGLLTHPDIRIRQMATNAFQKFRE